MITRRAAGALGVALVACQAKDEPAKLEYGEPVGIQMEASGALPAYELALAVDRGVDASPLVQPLSGVLNQALTACPDVIRDGKPDAVTQVAFVVDGGKLRDASVAGSRGDRCLLEKLAGKTLDVTRKVHVLIQLRAAPTR